MLKIESQKRETKALLNKKNQIAAVLYGKEMKENILLSLDYNNFEKIYNQAGTSQIISLSAEGKDYEVLIKQFQLDPVSDRFIHVDFYLIDQKQEIEVVIPFEFIGEAPAVKSGNVLNKVHTDIKLLCLPKNIPQQIEIDLSVLESESDSIRISNLKLPEGTKFANTNLDEVLVSVSAGTEDEEEEKEQVVEEKAQ